MKLIIDIPEDELTEDEIEEAKRIADDCFSGVKTIIPDNATNGDVIKAMFDTTEEHFYDEDRMVDVYGLDRSDDPSTFYADWWNAPYKAESEDREIKSVFTAEERADIMNAINEAFDQKNMNIEAVGYDDTNGVWLDVMVMKK